MRSLLDRVADLLGYVPRRTLEEDIRISGHVYAMWHTGGELVKEEYLGKNVFTERGRIAVAGMIARVTADVPVGVTFDVDEGYVSSDPVFPVEIGVGTGTTAASTEDTSMESPLQIAGSDARYALSHILFSRTVAGYGVDPISTSFYFDIPVGESYDGVGTDVDYEEWGLYDSTGGLMAHKVIRVSKLSALNLTIRWVIRT